MNPRPQDHHIGASRILRAPKSGENPPLRHSHGRQDQAEAGGGHPAEAARQAGMPPTQKRQQVVNPNRVCSRPKNQRRIPVSRQKKPEHQPHSRRQEQAGPFAAEKSLSVFHGIPLSAKVKRPAGPRARRRPAPVQKPTARQTRIAWRHAVGFWEFLHRLKQGAPVVRVDFPPFHTGFELGARHRLMGQQEVRHLQELFPGSPARAWRTGCKPGR